MSITKHVFTGTSLEAQASEMLSWLQANATDFFDSISIGGVEYYSNGYLALKG